MLWLLASCATFHFATPMSMKQNGCAMLNEGMTQFIYYTSSDRCFHGYLTAGYQINVILKNALALCLQWLPQFEEILEITQWYSRVINVEMI